MTSPADAINLFNKIGTDGPVHELRKSACHQISSALVESAKILHVGGGMLRSSSAEGTAVLTSIAGELAEAATGLYERPLWYAGAAVVRQIVEVEYLMWQFASDPQVAETWVTSSSDQIRSWFSPKAMRKRSQGRFRDTEYWTHCDLGGHPNPRARLLLNDWSSPVGGREWLWLDLLQHLRRLWSLTVSTIQELNLEETTTSINQRVEEALDAWIAVEDPRLLAIEIG